VGEPFGETVMKATDVLKAEHSVILNLIACLRAALDKAEKTTSLDIDTVSKSIDFFMGFVEDCHHRKEELFFFPEIENNPSAYSPELQGLLLTQHERSRAYVKALSEHLASYKKGSSSSLGSVIIVGRQFINLLAQHIEEENNSLFPSADNHLSDAEQENILDGFEKFERERLGVGSHQRYVNMVNQLCKRWSIDPLGTHRLAAASGF
jgi:hemerythrin-like domain-containing protein